MNGGLKLPRVPESDLEKKFNAKMYNLYSTPGKVYGKYFTRFKQMLDRYGGVETAKRLLATGDGQQGLVTLYDLEGLIAVERYSVEALVLRESWGDLFSADQLAEARRRLDSLKRNTSKT